MPFLPTPDTSRLEAEEVRISPIHHPSTTSFVTMILTPDLKDSSSEVEAVKSYNATTTLRFCLFFLGDEDKEEFGSEGDPWGEGGFEAVRISRVEILGEALGVIAGVVFPFFSISSLSFLPLSLSPDFFDEPESALPGLLLPNSSSALKSPSSSSVSPPIPSDGISSLSSINASNFDLSFSFSRSFFDLPIPGNTLTHPETDDFFLSFSLSFSFPSFSFPSLSFPKVAAESALFLLLLEGGLLPAFF